MMRAFLVIYLSSLFQDKDSALYYTGIILGLVYFSPLVFSLITRSIRSQIVSVYLGCIFLGFGYVLLANRLLILPTIILVIGAGLYSVSFRSVFQWALAPEGRRLPAEFNWLYFSVNMGSFLAPFFVVAMSKDVQSVFLTAAGLIILCLLFFVCGLMFRSGQDDRSDSDETKNDCGNPISSCSNSVEYISRRPTLIVLIVTAFSLLFWIGFEQKSIKLNAFAIERMSPTIVFGEEISPELLLSINPLFILCLSPILAETWRRLQNVNRLPNPVALMGSGLVCLGAGFLMLEAGVCFAADGKVLPIWFVALYAFHSIGELLLEPIGNDFVIRNSPQWGRAFFLAIWECTSGIALVTGPIIAILLGNSVWLVLGVAAVFGGAILIVAVRPFARNLA